MQGNKYQTLKEDHDAVTSALTERLKKTTKALDKACELLEINSMKRTDAHVYMSKEKWKEWLLRDE